MAFRVDVLPQANADIEEAVEFIALDSHRRAERWARELRRKILALEEMPQSQAICPESGELGVELRQFHHHAHRVIFRVVGDIVEVLRVYHGARRAFGPTEIP